MYVKEKSEMRGRESSGTNNKHTTVIDPRTGREQIVVGMICVQCPGDVTCLAHPTFLQHKLQSDYEAYVEIIGVDEAARGQGVGGEIDDMGGDGGEGRMWREVHMLRCDGGESSDWIV